MKQTAHPIWFLLSAMILIVGAPAFVQAQDDDAGDEELEEVSAEDAGAVAVDEDEGDEDVREIGREMADEQTVDDTTQGLGRPMPRPDSVGTGVIEELDAFEDALGAYEEEVADYRDTINRIIEVEYRRRRNEIRDFYNTEIDILRVEERARRNDAIVDFERFLERYPNDVEYTPDVMFRLAELYYEKAVDDYNLADEEYQRLAERYDLGLIPELPESPEKDFTRTVELFADLIDRFPNYRQIDGAY